MKVRTRPERANGDFQAIQKTYAAMGWPRGLKLTDKNQLQYCKRFRHTAMGGIRPWPYACNWRVKLAKEDKIKLS